jgi:hypothetical protein
MATKTKTTADELADAMADVETAREKLALALERRDHVMEKMHLSGTSLEQVARQAGDISTVGVYRAIQRRKAREERQ